ncbi:MAG: VOC family protein [Sphingomonadales bacterium]|nr:VOC family protein [Sphingomonadales bacterium]
MSGAVTGFNHVGISVADLDRAIAFYRDRFGMAQACDILTFGGEDYNRIMALGNPQGRMTMMTLGTLALELFEFHQPTPRPKDANYPVADHGLTHFGVNVTDIDAVFARLQAAGVRFHSEVIRFPGGMRAAYGRDPDGNVFELLERS